MADDELLLCDLKYAQSSFKCTRSKVQPTTSVLKMKGSFTKATVHRFSRSRGTGMWKFLCKYYRLSIRRFRFQFPPTWPTPLPSWPSTPTASVSLMSLGGLWAVRAVVCYWSWCMNTQVLSKITKECTKGMSGRSGSNKTEEIWVIHVLCSETLIGSK